MKTEYLQPFIAATRKVLSTMAMIESKPQKPYLKNDNQVEALGDISAVIELSGECKGSIGISFTKSCVLKIANQMLGEEISEINDEIADMVGELVNMISGDARRELVKLGMTFTAGIPLLLRGVPHHLDHYVQEKVIVIPFQTESGAFFIETAFDSAKFLE